MCLALLFIKRNDDMKITTDVLYLNNIPVALPAKNGISIGRYKTWSENSGRTVSGKAIGTIKYIKYKLEITWNELTADEIEKIDKIVSDKKSPFIPVKFRDLTGNMKQITCYFGDSVMPVYRYIDEKPIVDGYKLSAIEQ